MLARSVGTKLEFERGDDVIDVIVTQVHHIFNPLYESVIQDVLVPIGHGEKAKYCSNCSRQETFVASARWKMKEADGEARPVLRACPPKNSSGTAGSLSRDLASLTSFRLFAAPFFASP